ncbi:DUF2306 domain-containing protein [Actinophytocola xinjiangensis]|uniref:DUF2306 domain-containing protein n=1 Tax=Actinophytocola xinjiangensis TaxID=485602 RepID=UPI000A074D73|nr:DUF2306 domain-containing protein [Actinophytocola xinjiangensis]
MTQNIERTPPAAPDERPGGGLPRQRTVTARPATPWWRRPWMIPLWVITAAFLYLQINPFVGTPEAQAPVPPHDSFPPYYTLLIVHMIFGTIAMLTVCLQVWPWLRRQHPAVHRISGRFYVGASVVAGICGLVIMPFAPAPGKIGVTMSTTLWVVFTVVGYWAVRNGRYAMHRRYMLYSFALVMNNVWALFASKVVFGLELSFDFTYFAEGARWVGWVVNLMAVQWFLYRTARRPVEGPVR